MSEGAALQNNNRRRSSRGGGGERTHAGVLSGARLVLLTHLFTILRAETKFSTWRMRNAI